MTIYTKPILRYGLATPLLFSLVLLGAVGFALNKLSGVRKVKEERYAEQTLRLKTVQQLETEIAPKRPLFADQELLLKADQRQLLTRILDTAQKNYEVIELERSSLVVSPDRGRLGKRVQADLVRVQSSFQGGIGPMQETLLQVDALMPQAFLEEMKIARRPNPLRNRFDHLVIDVTHTCWMAGEESR